MKVRDLMTYPILAVGVETTVFEAIQMMVRESKGSVLVVEGGLLKEVVGIVTTSGLFRQVFAKGIDPRNVVIWEVMTPAPLVTIGPNETTRRAAEMMLEHKIRRLPVVECGALVGIITSKDLLRCVGGGEEGEKPTPPSDHRREG
ncbi:MAG TPA: CBS domain-containing protein [Methanothrix sp.]|jgi:CBS domain-containing protein|nr:MAG: inosine 5'-monophosphate dehydrogenase [Methanosaeta sp. PtaB.Bin087]HOI68805.1 CBS domain-containing protein [Methanothrix sp.]HPY73364.1 CBS domain-containing protein [Methanothrix sp.]HQA62984.1 CBS domain-containing protein [Methanothrix sp.]